MTRTQALLIAAFVLAPLFSVLVRAIRRRLEGQGRRPVEPEAPSVVPRVTTPPPLALARAPGSRATPRVTALGVAAAPAVPDGRTPSRLTGQRQVRRGVVLMTILGPCRALEPPGA
jgi:hypothetical protein